MSFYTNIGSLRSELLDEIKLFYPDFLECDSVVISHIFDDSEPFSCKCTVAINQSSYEYSYDSKSLDSASATAEPSRALGKREIKIFNKLSMYRALRDYTKREMPWGSLTGIRPTKLGFDMLKMGIKLDDIPLMLMSEYLVSREKALLVREIIENQSGLIENPETSLLFYVHIPFCKTICSYCAFTAEPINRSKSTLKEYINKLIEEIEQAKELAKSLGRRISAAYIGGGTPTSIDDEAFEAVLSRLDFKDIEFTCEAGRPDTITREKLKIMERYGVNRLCVNPQTLNDRTLKAIGRSHTLEDFLSAFKMARATGMDINVDLIAGLPSESFEDFKFSLDGVVELNPENITVHTLSIKNGAELKNLSYSHSTQRISRMTDFAGEALSTLGYIPYYLYRQKHMADNLENIGYAKRGKQCVYNIASMEEAVSVLASGAGGISKIICSKGRIERLANLRDVRLYIEQADERLNRKREFFHSLCR